MRWSHDSGSDFVNPLSVVIKGTQVYDTSKGQFSDLSILDVLQVFGRAGRPGLESSGEGYICTTEDRLAHYLDKVTSQVWAPVCFTIFLLIAAKNPIESKFVTTSLITSQNDPNHNTQVRTRDE